ALSEFTDPFAPPEPAPTPPAPKPNALPAIPTDTNMDFGAHATAVYDVARLAQSPEALGEAPADLEQDVPGGLGPATGEVATPEVPSSTSQSNFSAPPSQGIARRVTSVFVTLLMLVAAVGGGFYSLIRTGRIDAAAVGLESLVPETGQKLSGGYEDVYPASMRSILYPTRVGTSLLVFTGEVENMADVDRGDLDVLAQVVNDEGQVTASGRSPVGVTLDVGELASVVDRRALNRPLTQKVDEGMASPVGPGERRRFMVVLPSPPAEVSALRHTISIVPSVYTKVPAPPAGDELDADPDTLELAPPPTESPRKKRRRNKRAKRARAE
ncbi:MAG: hypothetical protein AAF658_16325, partial [Myxococcota bacterium]